MNPSVSGNPVTHNNADPAGVPGPVVLHQILSASGLCCSRNDVPLFRSLDFTVSAGQLLLIEGANGSGKTTLLKAICGFIRPDAGVITWCGHTIDEVKDEYINNLLYVGHSNGIKLGLTALENLRVSQALLARVKHADAHEVLVQFDMAASEDIPAQMLSSGQRRRLALSRLAIGHAGLWVLDEPFTSLDTRGRSIIKGLISEHLTSGGIILMTSHDEVVLDGIPVIRIRI